MIWNTIYTDRYEFTLVDIGRNIREGHVGDARHVSALRSFEVTTSHMSGFLRRILRISRRNF